MAAQLMIIGSGAIATELIERLPLDIQVAAIVTSTRSVNDIRMRYPDTIVVDKVSAVSITPDFVVECAGHAGLQQHAPDVLARGWQLGIVSSGALCDDKLYETLLSQAKKYGGQLQILSGAIAGLDGLSAACEQHSDDQTVQVTYTATKPVQGWKGTPAETLIPLNTLTERTVFYRGNAREAAKLFPQNANVAATIALKGVGFEATQVELAADPNSQYNQHNIDIRGAFGEMQLQLIGRPLPNNPKTSYLTVLSILNACKNAMTSKRTVI